MTAFFSVADNTEYTRGFPWVFTVEKGLEVTAPCPRCELADCYPTGPLDAFLMPDRGTRWPDCLGTSPGPTLIVSQRTLAAWEAQGVPDLPRYEVRIVDPLPKKLRGAKPPKYYWLDGAKMRGALLDFEASGYVGVEFCPECGQRTHDIEATEMKGIDAPSPFVFRPGTWDGSPLFTTDLSDAWFFCTEAILECARKHRLLNFEFVPIEKGDGEREDIVKYM